MLVRFKTVPTIFDEFENLFQSTLAPFPVGTRFNTINRFSGVTMKDSGEQINVTIALPGIKKEDVQLKLNDNALTVTAERKQPQLQENEQWIRNEISYGKFERTIDLPYSVDVDNVAATHENGILSIVLPKHENAKPRQISIR